MLTAAELGEALGRSASVHVAILPGGIAERLRLDCARLSAYDLRGDAGGARDADSRSHDLGESRDAND